MRLTFSSSHFLNADLLDEQRRVLYTIRTTSESFTHKTTTIKKHSNGHSGGFDIIATIDWHTFRSTELHFNGGLTINASVFLEARGFSGDRHFVGPDGRGYKWKLRASTRNCVLQPEGSHVELVKFHKENLGIMSPYHGPYLEISPSVTHMLDLIVITFVYVEKQSHDEHELMES